MSEWATRAPEKMTALFGLAELHVAVFQPNSDPGGAAPVVAISIPENEAFLPSACATATAIGSARVVLVCDTHEQADATAEEAAAMLPKHRRVALDRLETGDWSTQ